MKTITLLLIIGSINVAQAQIYKCPGKTEGRYTYQERPCKGARADEHTLKIIPVDRNIIAAAQEKLAKELEADKLKELPMGTKVITNDTNVLTQKVQTTASTGSADNATPASVATQPPITPKTDTTSPTPATANPMPY